MAVLNTNDYQYLELQGVLEELVSVYLYRLQLPVEQIRGALTDKEPIWKVTAFLVEQAGDELTDERLEDLNVEWYK